MIAAQVDWGSVPTWLALTAAVVAGGGYASSRRDASRAAAARVHAVVMSFVQSTDDEDRHTTVHVHNRGESPIFDITIALFESGRRRRFWRFRNFEDCMTGERILSPTIHAMMPLSSSEEMRLPGLDVSFSEKSFDRPPVVLRFGDENGRRWIRWNDGRLSRIRRRS